MVLLRFGVTDYSIGDVDDDDGDSNGGGDDDDRKTESFHCFVRCSPKVNVTSLNFLLSLFFRSFLRFLRSNSVEFVH